MYIAVLLFKNNLKRETETKRKIHNEKHGKKCFPWVLTLLCQQFVKIKLHKSIFLQIVPPVRESKI